MKATNIKGALLEYIVRNLLKNCGFTNVKADNLYTYERGGLFFVNGKGAAHDADVIMNPPIQMPFSYPTQLIFECKAYDSAANLPIVRNALGLRNDLNDFEIVTKDSLLKRQNNRRASYAVETRRRFLFQVGVATINDFTKPAVEFATNNKIPLLSLSWFLDARSIKKLNDIDQLLIDSFHPAEIQNLYDLFKNRSANKFDSQFNLANGLLRSDNIIADVVEFAESATKHGFVGLLETGDMVYLFPLSSSDDNVLNQASSYSRFKAEIHWWNDRPDVWILKIYNTESRYQYTEFKFFIPKRIFQQWKQFNLSKSSALDIKQEFFSKIFVFNGRNNQEYPFSIINIDKRWLDEARQDLDED